LVAAAHVVRPALGAFGDDGVDGAAVVHDVQPLAPMGGRPVGRQGPVVECIGGEQRDDLLGELVWAVVVAAVADRDRKAVGLVIGAHGVVGACLRGVVGRAGPVGRVLGERSVAVEGQV